MEKGKVICVVGLGYIGLPTACLFARAGYNVVGVDIDEEKINLLRKKKLPFQEPGLEKLFKEAVENLEFSLEPRPADVFIIAVPTPITDNKKPDLKFVKQAARSVDKVLGDGNLVIIESTVPPGTARRIVLPILKKKHKDREIYLAHAPERAIPGKTLKEMIGNDRVIGGVDEKSGALARGLYLSFVKGKIYLTNATTAEFVKLIENTFRDINIAFANELAKLCTGIDVDVWEAIKLANLHPRVNIHLPGPGVGGHCISVDPWFLIREDSVGNDIIKLARYINDSMPVFVVKRVSEVIRGIRNPAITILGVAYKGDVDDWRETPALEIIKLAKKKGWRVRIHDPFVKNFPYKVERDFGEATRDSDCLVLVANHNFYRNVLPVEIKNMRNKTIFDTRRLIDRVSWEAANFKVAILGDVNSSCVPTR